MGRFRGRLVVCASCQVHIKVAERVCPHCGARRASSVGAVGTIALGLAVAGCPADEPGDGDTAVDDWLDVGEDAYGVPDTGIFDDDGVDTGPDPDAADTPADSGTTGGSSGSTGGSGGSGTSDSGDSGSDSGSSSGDTASDGSGSSTATGSTGTPSASTGGDPPGPGEG